MDDQNQTQNPFYDPMQGQMQQNPQPQQQYVSAGGSPESSPSQSPSQESVAQPEFGNEFIKKLDNDTTPDQAERRDNTQYDDPMKQQYIPLPPKPVAQDESALPRYFGYQIPPTITSDTTMINSYAGQGDPSASKTWIYVLLKKMMKMHKSQ